MTGSGWASPSGEPAPINPGEPAPINPGEPAPINPGEPAPINPGEPAPEESTAQPAAGPDAPPYYQPLPGGGQGWGTPALPPGSPDPTPPPFPQPDGYGAFGGHDGFGQGPGDVKPGIAPLRPLTTGELLDAAFTAMRRYPRALIVPGTVLSIVGTLLDLAIQAATDRHGTVSGRGTAIEFTAIVLTVVATTVLAMIASAFGAVVVQRGVLGQPVPLGEAWAAVRHRGWLILGAAVVSTVFWLVAAVGIFIPGIYVYVIVHFACVVLVIEGGSVGGSIRRSRRLIRGAWWRTFGLMLLVGLIAGIVGDIIAAPFTVETVGVFLHSHGSVSLGTQAIGDIGALLAGIVTIPFAAAATALIYLDRRMRVEGLDVALRQAAGA